jgi:SAM-dependent methyltransferase
VPRSAPPDAFGRAAQEYELGRPDWPTGAVDRVVDELGVTPGATVLDLAAGTGKLTRLLADRFERVLAVEPDAAMRELLADAAPAAEAVEGTAEAIPVEDEAVEAVFVGEAFHWFDGPAAVREIARILRPRGGLALLWNLPRKPVEPRVPPAADELLDAALERGGRPGGPLYRSGVWRHAFEGAPFDELGETHIDYDLVVERERLIAYYLSVSSIASQPDQDRRALALQLRELIPDRPYRRFFTTDLFWTKLAA